MSYRHKFNYLKLLFNYGFVLKKPNLLFRLLTVYLKALILPVPPLRYIDFALDYRCNLKCKHCFAQGLINKKVKLTLSDYRRIACECRQLGVTQFSFQGGEPLLLPNLEKIIKIFQPQSSYIALTTNGTLLNEQKIKRLKSLGVDKISFSLDSGIAGEHDHFRGQKGVFVKAWQSMQDCLRLGMKVTINTTVSHQNLRSPGIKKLFDYATANKIILNPIFAVPLGRWAKSKKVLLTISDRKYIKRLQSRSAYLKRDINSNYFKTGCSAVSEVLYIDPYGDVLPCPFLHIVLGNIKKESLKTIRDRALKNFSLFGRYHPLCFASEDIKTGSTIYQKFRHL